MMLLASEQKIGGSRDCLDLRGAASLGKKKSSMRAAEKVVGLFLQAGDPDHCLDTGSLALSHWQLVQSSFHPGPVSERQLASVAFAALFARLEGLCRLRRSGEGSHLSQKATCGEMDMLADWFARSFEELQTGIAFGWGGRAVGDWGRNRFR